MSRKESWLGMNWIRQCKRLAIYQRDSFACLYCGSSHKLTLDHIIPVAEGGTNHESNLVTCCHACNTSKGKKSVKAFAKAATKRIVKALSVSLKPHRIEAKQLIAKYGSAAKAVAAMA